jgi:ankyrin repeat protein
MSRTTPDIAGLILSGDLSALSSISNLPDLLHQPLYGRFTNKSLAFSNPLPLQLAILYEKLEIANYLLTIGAAPNETHPQSDAPPPIHIAVGLSLWQAVQLLFSKRASLEILNESGLTPLHHALIASDLPTFQQLVAIGAQVAAVNPNGDTVIHAAARSNKMLQYQLLDQIPANRALVNRQGVTAASLLQQNYGQQQQFVAVDAAAYQGLKNRLLALEVGVGRLAGGQGLEKGNCPVCGKTFEDPEWTAHVRKGCLASK